MRAISLYATSFYRERGRIVLMLLLTVGLAILLASQIETPRKRVLESLVGIAFLTATLRFPVTISLAVLSFLFMFPAYLSIGTTTTIFIFLVFSMWLVRISLRQESFSGGTALDIPIFLLAVMYVVSFRYIRPEFVFDGLVGLEVFISCVILYYMTVSAVRTEAHVRLVVNVLSASCIFAVLLSLNQVFFPQKILLPFLYHREATQTLEGVRAGGVMGDYELFAEYVALMIPIMLYMFVSSRKPWVRVTWLVGAVLCVVALVSTATRGAFVSLSVGMLYFLFLSRNVINPIKSLAMVFSLAVAFLIASAFLQQHSEAAGLFDRLSNTSFVSFMPDTRKTVWIANIASIRESPFVGHGPYHPAGQWVGGAFQYWPHSVILCYLYYVGVFGLIPFLILMLRLFIVSLVRARRLATGFSFAQGLLVVLHVDLVVFMIDETKIEYLRQSGYQQFIWMLFALIIVCSRIVDEQRAELEGSVEGRSRPRPSSERSPTVLTQWTRRGGHPDHRRRKVAGQGGHDV